MLKKIVNSIACLQFFVLNAQNTASITLNTVPVNYSVDSYTRATTQINLLPGFKYGPATTGATNLLNLSISSYPSYVNNNYTIPSNNSSYYNSNPNLELGITTGNGNVNVTGSFNYNLPIICSPGTANMSPKLNITYNSASENNGWLGYGFNLVGISMISRVGSNVYDDGKNGGVSFSSTDKFSLDGSRLLAGTGTYGQNGSTYRKEVDVYDRIESHGSFGGGPSYFIVATTSGLIYEYGNTTDSKSTDASNSEILAWYVNKIKDVFGNYMTFTYSSINGETVISKIEYTGNDISNFAPYNKVEFAYVNRSDFNAYYIAGKTFNRTNLLKTIICKDINGNSLHQYSFDYKYDFASLLSKITESDANGNQLNPTFFMWNNDNKVDTYTQYPITTQYNPSNPNLPYYMNNVAADVNGDGKRDLVCLRSNSPMVDIKYNTFSNSSYPHSPYEFDPISLDSVNMTYSSNNFIASFAFDEDDDNIDEIFIAYINPSSGPYTNYSIKKIKWNGLHSVSVSDEIINNFMPATVNSQYWGNIGVLFNPHANLYNNSSLFLAKQDITGDNVKDRIVVDQNKIIIQPNYLTNTNNYFFNLNTIIKAQLGDFNGDGILDIYTLQTTSVNGSYNVFVYSFDPSSNTLNQVASEGITTGLSPYNTSWYIYDSTLKNIVNGSKSIDFGDIDGDSKTDIFYINYASNANGNINCLRSNGLAFLVDPAPKNIPLTLNGYEAVFSTSDVNNDRNDDLVLTSVNTQTPNTYFAFYPSNGNQLVDMSAVQIFNDQYLGSLADFDGDNTLDYAYQSNTWNANISFNSFNANNHHLVNRIINLKNDYQINYQFLFGASQQRNTSYYTSFFPYRQIASSSSALFSKLKPNMYIVTASNENGFQKRFSYENSIFHRAGKGFLGFEKIYETQLSNNYRSSVTSFTYNFNYDDIDKSNNLITSSDGGINIYNSVNSKNSANTLTEYNYVVTSGIYRYLSSTQITSKNYLNSTFSKSIITYDNTNGGTVLSNFAGSYAWGTSSIINSREIDYLYNVFNMPGTSYPYYRVQQTNNINSSASASANYISNFNYNPSTGNLVSSVVNSNIPNFAVTTNYQQFNMFGSPQKVIVSAPDISPPRSNEVQFDVTGRFIVKSTNSLGNFEQATYEPSYGNIIQSINTSGLVSNFNYDGMGRPVKSILPTGAINTTKYEWFLSDYDYIGSNSIGVYSPKITTTNATGGQTITYVDKNGNITKTQSTAFNGSVAVTEYVYNNVNQVTLVNGPYFNGQTLFNSTYFTRDTFNRVIEIDKNISSLYSGSGGLLNSTTYSYNALSTDLNYNNGFVMVKNQSNGPSGFEYTVTENNEAGQVTKTRNYSNSSQQNSSNYSFDNNGNITQLTTNFPSGSGNATTSFAYDALGRQILINDPSLGIRTISYNSIGEVLSQSGPNGNYTFLYDQLGRMTQKTGSTEGTTTYQYVTSGNGLLALNKIIGPNVTNDYTYDSFDRISQEKQTINAQNKQFTKQYAYDMYNRLTNYTYPGGFTTNYLYDASNTLTQIKYGNNVLWQLTDLEAPTLLKQYNYNNGALNTQLTYNNLMQLSQKQFGNISTQSYSINTSNFNVDNRDYQNFISNTNNNENFNYDDFDRLTKITYNDPLNNVITKTNIAYAPNGNISHKDDAGDYIYGNTAQPYLLTNINNASPNINTNQLNLTYNNFDKVSQITLQGVNKQFNFTYGNNNQRVKMDYSINGANQYTRYYQGNYERQESAGSYKEWSYISTPSGPGAVYYNNNGTAQLLYITTDHLGSPIMLTDTNNNIVEEYSFDAWGRRRNPANWNDYTVTPPQYIIRGFTMHEHLDEVGLINMNGRIYDPVLGRFIQADKITQDPSNTQNLNRYSYVMNNPLKYTDPSGYLKVQPNDNLGTGGPAQYGTLAQYVDAPVLYVDGVRIEPGMGGYGFWLNGGSGGGGGISGISTLGNSSLYGNNVTSYNSEYNTQIAAIGAAIGFGGGEVFGGNYTLSGAGFNNLQQKVDNDFYEPQGGTTLPEVQITYSNSKFSEPNYDIHAYVQRELDAIGGGEGWNTTNTTLNAFGFASGIKETIIEGGAALNRGVNISKVNDISLIRTYGTAGAKYLKYSKGLGVIGSIVTTGYSMSNVVDQYNAGGVNNVFSHRDVLDAGVGTIGLGATTLAAFGLISNPIGWGIGAGVLIYGGVTLIYDATTKP